MRALVAIALAGLAHAGDLPPSAEVDLLYSNQFTFTRAGLPLHRIRIAEGLDQVRIDGRDMILRAGGPEGPQLRGADGFTVRTSDAKAARVRYWIVAARLKPGDTDGTTKAIAELEGRAKQVRVFELGYLFAVNGRSVDGRQLIVGIGPYSNVDSATAKAQALGLSPSLHVELVERSTGMLRALASGQSTRLRVKDLIWFKPGPEPLKVQGKPYPGDIYVTLDQHGKIAVVNAVDEQRLLSGLLPAEIPLKSPMEALKAQAVAARTTLLATIGTRHLADPYGLCSEVHCQAYTGVIQAHPRAREAVEATRGQVLLEKGGHLLDARWSACCGGHTENNELVWASAPISSLRGKPDGSGLGPGKNKDSLRAFLEKDQGAYCSIAKGRYRWSEKLDAREVGKALGIGKLDKLIILSRGRSGRALSLRAEGTAGQREIRGELRIRRRLGNLKSSLFVVDRKGDSFTLHGGGHGHGVGLCQMGAIGRAKDGHRYRQILAHYYRGSHIAALY